MHEIQPFEPYLIRLGATKVPHLDGSLLEHFVQVHGLLARMKRPSYVCLAGLFHGVYGTQAQRPDEVAVMEEGRRDDVRALIGEAAERVVHHFCVMTYDSLGRSFRSVLRPHGQPDIRDRHTGDAIVATREDFNDVLWVKLADLLAHVPERLDEKQKAVTVEFGSFWQVVCEYLGREAVDEWNRALGDVMAIH